MTNLWAGSIELMLLGMGTVFVFLILLTFGVTIMSTIINRFAPPEIISPKPAPATTAATDVAAVAAAVWATANQSKK